MYILNISVSENREVLISSEKAGSTLENNVTLLSFEIPKAYSDYYKYLDIVKGDSERTQTVLSTADEVKFSYRIPYELTDKLTLMLQLVMKKGESIFKSNTFKVTFNSSLCATQCLEGEYIDTIEYIMENKADLKEIDKLKSAMEAKLDKSSYYDHIIAQEAVNDRKVDKLDGKGLSANDYTDEEKEKLGKLPANKEYQAEISKINENIALKADKAHTLAGYGIADAYTKEKTDDLLAQLDDKKADIGSVLPIDDSYHRDYIDELLSLKADKSDSYTKAEIDTQINTFDERIGYLENDMGNKADISDTYTKEEIDSQLIDVNGRVDDVNDYINDLWDAVNNTYTKEEIDSQIGSIETALDNIIAIQEALIGGES